ncbi:zinc finger CCCH-type antiviral protein 1-like [Pelodytes ibericus]
MSDPAITAFLTKLLCANGGRLLRYQLAQHVDLPPEQIEQILQDEARRFPQCGDLLLARSSLRICPRYRRGEEEEEECDQLHLCAFYMRGKCWKNKKPQCKFSHNTQSEHNLAVLKANDVSGLNNEELKILLFQNDHSLLPRICVKYLHNQCDQETCTGLHVCGYFTQGECTRHYCKKSHNLLETPSLPLFKRSGIPNVSIQNFQLLATLKHQERFAEWRAQSRAEKCGGAPRGRGWAKHSRGRSKSRPDAHLRSTNQRMPESGERKVSTSGTDSDDAFQSVSLEDGKQKMVCIADDLGWSFFPRDTTKNMGNAPAVIETSTTTPSSVQTTLPGTSSLSEDAKSAFLRNTWPGTSVQATYSFTSDLSSVPESNKVDDSSNLSSTVSCVGQQTPTPRTTMPTNVTATSLSAAQQANAIQSTTPTSVAVISFSRTDQDKKEAEILDPFDVYRSQQSTPVKPSPPMNLHTTESPRVRPILPLNPPISKLPMVTIQPTLNSTTGAPVTVLRSETQASEAAREAAIKRAQRFSPESQNIDQRIKNLDHQLRQLGVAAPPADRVPVGHSISPSVCSAASDGTRRHDHNNVTDFTEICLYSVWKHCKNMSNCSEMHYHLPYRWQVLTGTTWNDLANMESFEKAFSNPKMDRFSTVDFQTMKSGSNLVRRLCTLSSVLKPSYVLTTEWLWYWQDELGTWIQYGKSNPKNVSASIMSSDLESIYLSDSNATIPFQAGPQQYHIDFQAMTQRNLVYKTQRDVRRRPKFLSFDDVRRLKGSTQSVSSASSPAAGNSPLRTATYPSNWDPTAIPEFGHKLVDIVPVSPEYSAIKNLFHSTISGYVVKKIQRIQNLGLWQVYQWQKGQLKKGNRGVDVAERQLFHGTSSTHVTAICNQNFDWRICGTHGTVYGQGSYFATDASYSHNYSPDDGRGKRAMFVARVLVGNFVRGNANLRLPPSPYNSCVDNVLQPSIFVVFEKHQIYPEYLIEYEQEKKSCCIS